ncbi:MAG: hypothetical protein HOI34_20760, partial [Rhodospirillaceae bacterium]|nr:hypothetical protein [Rhodospirillaceae bacterium]
HDAAEIVLARVTKVWLGDEPYKASIGEELFDDERLPIEAEYRLTLNVEYDVIERFYGSGGNTRTAVSSLPVWCSGKHFIVGLEYILLIERDGRRVGDFDSYSLLGDPPMERETAIEGVRSSVTALSEVSD